MKTIMMTHAERAQRRAKIIAEGLAGASIAVLSTKHELEPRYIRKLLESVGVRSPLMPKLSSFQILATLIHTDRGQEDIGAEFHVTPQWVSLIQTRAVRAGIALHPSRRARKSRRGKP